METNDEEDGYCLVPMNAEPLPGVVLVAPLRGVVGITRVEQIPQDVVDEIVPLLAGRVSIDGKGANREGASLYIEFSLVWEEYLMKHKDVRTRIDPIYVIVQHSLPQGFASAVSTYHGGQRFAGVPLPGGINGTTCSFAFPHTPEGRGHAYHFMGHLSNAFPDITMWMLRSTLQLLSF